MVIPFLVPVCCLFFSTFQVDVLMNLKKMSMCPFLAGFSDKCLKYDRDKLKKFISK